jgi:hypothetical protein
VARKTQQVETRLLAEYLKLTYYQYSYIDKVPLGAVSKELMSQVGYQTAIGLSRPMRPEADALVLHPKYLILIEAKVWHIVDGLAKLPLYKSLVPVTPELKTYLDRPVLLELVVPWTNPNLEMMASRAGVAIRIYKPAWINEVVARVQNYSTPEYRQAREEKLRNRELLGLE